MNEYTFRPLNPEDIPRLTELLQTCFSFRAKDAIGAVRWKYPEGKDTISYVAVAPDGSIVGHYANKKVPVSYNGNMMSAYNCIDMCTHPDHRGKGLISRLSKLVYADVAKTNAVLSFGFSNEEGVQVDKHAKGYGYQIVGTFQRYTKMVMPSFSSRGISSPIKTVTHNTLLMHDARLRIAKDKQYLTWRYVSRPEHSYLRYEITVGKETGYVILFSKGINLLILDCVGFSMETLPFVFAHIEKEAQRLHKTMVVTHVLQNEVWKTVMNQAGYKMTPSRSATYFTGKLHKPEKVKTIDVMDPNSWILMPGDIW